MRALNILQSSIKTDYDFLDKFKTDEELEDYILLAIKEIEDYITNYQGIKRILDNTVVALSVLQNENKSLLTILEKYNEEMIELRKENEDLKERSKWS